MEINLDKTTDLFFRRPTLNHSILPDPVCSIEQVTKINPLPKRLGGLGERREFPQWDPGRSPGQEQF